MEINFSIHCFSIPSVGSKLYFCFDFRDMLIEQLMREINELRDHLHYVESHVSSVIIFYQFKAARHAS